jgi:G3E family GTPase
VVTKTDLGDPAPLLPRLAALNPAARVTEARHGVLDPEAVLHAGLFDAAGKIAGVRSWLDAAAFDTTGHAHHHDPNRHDARIGAFCVTIREPVHWPALAMWLEMLVASKGDHLLRVKGILNLRDQDRPVAIHAVRHLIHPPVKLASWAPGDSRESRLVFITRDLPRAAVEDGLLAFLRAAA